MDGRLEGKKKWIRGLHVSEENTGEGQEKNSLRGTIKRAEGGGASV
jgi:hypothetical protein